MYEYTLEIHLKNGTILSHCDNIENVDVFSYELDSFMVSNKIGRFVNHDKSSIILAKPNEVACCRIIKNSYPLIKTDQWTIVQTDIEEDEVYNEDYPVSEELEVVNIPSIFEVEDIPEVDDYNEFIDEKIINIPTNDKDIGVNLEENNFLEDIELLNEIEDNLNIINTSIAEPEKPKQKILKRKKRKVAVNVEEQSPSNFILNEGDSKEVRQPGTFQLDDGLDELV